MNCLQHKRTFTISIQPSPLWDILIKHDAHFEEANQSAKIEFIM